MKNQEAKCFECGFLFVLGLFKVYSGVILLWISRNFKIATRWNATEVCSTVSMQWGLISSGELEKAFRKYECWTEVSRMSRRFCMKRGERTFQAERASCANALWQEGAWCKWGTETTWVRQGCRQLEKLSMKRGSGNGWAQITQGPINCVKNFDVGLKNCGLPLKSFK